MVTAIGSVKIALAAGVSAGLAVVVATIWIGARVREDTVVAKPYEEGLGHDADRRARATLGLRVSLHDEAPEVGTTPLAFGIGDSDGRPVDDAGVTVEISRPETGREARSAVARPQGGGRYAVDLAFPAPGPWDVRFDVRRGPDRVRLERRVAARAGCDLAVAPCTRSLAGGGEITLEVTPRPPRTMKALAVRAEVREAGPPAGRAEVSASFSMPGMEMGENRTALAPVAPGRWEGTAVLVRCPSGKREWVADVAVMRPGVLARGARFSLTVAE